MSAKKTRKDLLYASVQVKFPLLNSLSLDLNFFSIEWNENNYSLLTHCSLRPC